MACAIAQAGPVVRVPAAACESFGRVLESSPEEPKDLQFVDRRPSLARIHRHGQLADTAWMCKSAGMGPSLNSILDVRLYQAFDLDPDGRVLAGSDDTGSTQLIEIEPDGTTTPLTALPGACTGRYLPGQRAVIVSHDDGGNELHQLSVLRLPRPSGQPAGLEDLEPLVRDPRYMHT